MLGLLVFSFQFKPVQTWAAKKATHYLSKELNTKVDIKSLYIKPFSSVVLEGLYVLDKQKDTLLRTPLLTVQLSGFSVFNSISDRKIDFKNITLTDGSFYLKKLKNKHTNLQFILDYFNSGSNAPKKKSKPWTTNFERITLNNFHFRYKNQLVDTIINGVNFDDINLTGLNIATSHLDLKNHLFKAAIENLAFKEKSGFIVQKLASLVTIDTNQIELQKLTLNTPHSRVRNYFRMGFKSFDDFDNFEHKVMMTADFKDAHLSSADIAFFADKLHHVKFELGLDGVVKGKVDNLKAKNLAVQAGQATYIKGNFSMKGLPDWEQTLMELNIEQVSTNKKDLDLLYKNFADKRSSAIPAIVDKFGNISFSGQFTGFQNDFVAYGKFKTKLGSFSSDVNMKIKGDVPSYSGNIKTFDFNFGSLLNEPSLNRATISADVNGAGFDLKTLTGKLDAKIQSLDFNRYRYSNVNVNGTFRKKYFDGAVLVNDPNLKLNFKGNVDLNPALPVFHFKSDIKGAQLNKLHFLKDTLSVDAQFSSNFSGNSIDNINGNLLLRQVRLTNPSNNYLVDSLYFAAEGTGRSRELTLKSSLADGSLKGDYDLNTLPSYFKTLVKKYIPSLQTKFVPPKPQNFAFRLNLKNLDPITTIFIPKLKIPEQGTFVGNFNSFNKTATLNGLIKTIQYDKMVFHDLLIDESTVDDFIGVNISLSKVNITDSLFIKDINITNFLKRDSLNFNIKLSDKNAINQLDLYGLVEFGRDTTAKLKILPSDIIIEQQKWRIAEQVRIRLLENARTQIANFVLSNGVQKIGIDGYISPKPDDKLKVTFDNFNLASLDQLTKSAGIKLSGVLNGNAVLNAVTNNPGVESDLHADSISINKTLIGNLKLSAQLDNANKTALVNLNLLNKGLETLNVNGKYNLASEDNKLDFHVKMNQTEAVILDPLVNDLVSKLSGHISADLDITGMPEKPQINGSISLQNTGLTINYLKTPYIINDNVVVKNSIIEINNLQLKDNRKGTGIVNGTVNLNNLSNPDIEATIDARNLLALNTAFKDNRLYYGTAFTTGKFSFKGPTDNMRIDIKAKTEEGTVFNIPLNSSSTASNYDFITYISRNSSKNIKKDRSFNGVTLNFDLTIDEKTLVKITTDYGQLEGSGTANNLQLNINSSGDFEMRGDYLISNGKFEFTAQNFISKVFQVNEGGTIRWTGDPSNAEINLKAIYEVRTDINDLYRAAGLPNAQESQQKLVEAEMILTKSLTHPEIDFNFNFPNDPAIKDELAAYLNDATNRNQQALSLIVRRKFATGTGGENLTKEVGSTAQDAISEFAFNKLNNFISQSNIKNFDLNIRSFNDASASFRLFNNRLLLNGSLYNNQVGNDLFNQNTTTLFNSNFSNFTKDFEAQYLISKDGKLTAKYSYRALNSTTLNTINDQLGLQYVNGLGLVYQQDFDSFSEFLRNIFNRRRNSRKNPAPGSGTSKTNTVLDDN
ncbi:translocation/assembly module TamB domain-containing protein [Mucilaginibacter arboris]|uniref:Translocation/assembly module TamB n=1 Tax=Mucilaginibacter arboris TaxID=2682090 RepID=A0A7K1SZ47_9SPHI|nr:translocation/assembly module TamB domain-containing protein [Mucilaginibacter arboris]MVN22596.1 translocation/assembly module TamB [Mucilaginibacter arboris]